VHALMLFAQGDEPGKIPQFFGHFTVVPLAEATYAVGFRADVVLVTRQIASERANQSCVPLLVLKESLFQLGEHSLQLISGGIVEFYFLAPMALMLDAKRCPEIELSIPRNSQNKVATL